MTAHPCPYTKQLCSSPQPRQASGRRSMARRCRNAFAVFVIKPHIIHLCSPSFALCTAESIASSVGVGIVVFCNIIPPILHMRCGLRLVPRCILQFAACKNQHPADCIQALSDTQQHQVLSWMAVLLRTSGAVPPGMMAGTTARLLLLHQERLFAVQAEYPPNPAPTRQSSDAFALTFSPRRNLATGRQYSP